MTVRIIKRNQFLHHLWQFLFFQICYFSNDWVRSNEMMQIPIGPNWLVCYNSKKKIKCCDSWVWRQVCWEEDCFWTNVLWFQGCSSSLMLLKIVLKEIQFASFGRGILPDITLSTGVHNPLEKRQWTQQIDRMQELLECFWGYQQPFSKWLATSYHLVWDSNSRWS